MPGHQAHHFCSRSTYRFTDDRYGSLVETATADTGMNAVVKVTSASRLLHPFIAVNLLRVCQEALGHAQRYSHARAISVELTFALHTIELEIRDDGVGFVFADVEHAGFGLAGMRERAQRVNGDLNIFTALGAGTRILLQVPLSEVSEALP